MYNEQKNNKQEKVLADSAKLYFNSLIYICKNKTTTLTPSTTRNLNFVETFKEQN